MKGMDLANVDRYARREIVRDTCLSRFALSSPEIFPRLNGVCVCF